MTLWRIPRRHQNSGPGQTRPCRAARIPVCPGRGHGSSRSDRHTDRPPAGTCRGTSCTSGSASNRDRSSIPSHPRRDSPRRCSARTDVPSGSDPCRSTAPARSRDSGGHRKCRPGHLRPSGRRANGHGRGGSNSRRLRFRCSPHGRFPTGVRSGKVPTSSRELSSFGLLQDGIVRHSSISSRLIKDSPHIWGASSQGQHSSPSIISLSGCSQNTLLFATKRLYSFSVTPPTWYGIPQIKNGTYGPRFTGIYHIVERSARQVIKIIFFVKLIIRCHVKEIIMIYTIKAMVKITKILSHAGFASLLENRANT